MSTACSSSPRQWAARCKSRELGAASSRPLPFKASCHRTSGSMSNNAASKSADLDAFFASTEKYSLPEWRKIMSVNVDGMFLVAQAVGGQMQKQGTGGSIIQTSSIYGLVSSDKRIDRKSTR